jgi:hypothetical protein
MDNREGVDGFIQLFVSLAIGILDTGIDPGMAHTRYRIVPLLIQHFELCFCHLSLLAGCVFTLFQQAAVDTC